MLRMEIALFLVVGFIACVYLSAEKKDTPLGSYPKGQSYVGYGVTREGCTVFLCFKRILAVFFVFLPLLQSVPFLLEY